mmetsp:Transcript_139139/g.444500  ORF Transcript_139139/g.444500 Transcript_139139/m.444500 type:complete len:205 (-) Transcript_139139:793-1407(-)
MWPSCRKSNSSKIMSFSLFDHSRPCFRSTRRHSFLVMPRLLGGASQEKRSQASFIEAYFCSNLLRNSNMMRFPEAWYVQRTRLVPWPYGLEETGASPPALLIMPIIDVPIIDIDARPPLVVDVMDWFSMFFVDVMAYVALMLLAPTEAWPILVGRTMPTLPPIPMLPTAHSFVGESVGDAPGPPCAGLDTLLSESGGGRFLLGT